MVKQALIEDVMTGAFEGGINYWATSAKLISSDKPRGKITSNTYYSPKNFVWGLNTEDGLVYLRQNELIKAIENHSVNDPEDWDAEDYDTIVQMACFNDIIYG